MATLARISIVNTERAKKAAEELSASAVELDSVRVSIENILQELGQFWSLSQQDAQGFAAALQNEASFLQNFAANSKELSNIVINYINRQEQNAANTSN